MTINERPEKTKEVIPTTPESFKGKQLELFKTFLCNDGQREEFSNALMLWDRAIGCADDRRRIIRERCASLCSAHITAHLMALDPDIQTIV